MLIRAPFESASRPIAENSFSGIPSGPCLTTSSSGPLGGRQVAGRDNDRGADRDQEVDDACNPEAREQHLRVGADRVLGLLGDIDRVLEPDQGVERERGAGEHRGEDAGPLLELEGATRVGIALAERDQGDDHDQDQAGDLDQGEADVELHRLRDPAQVDQRDQDQQRQGADHDLEVDELGQVVAAKAARERARRCDPRADHREGDDEGEKAVLERPVDVERGSPGVRVLGDELRVGAGRERRHHQGEEERGPDRPTGLGADLTDERVDAAAEDVADDEQQEQLRGDRASEARAVVRVGGGRAAGRHRRFRASPLGHGDSGTPSRSSQPRRAASNASSESR